MAYLLSFDPSKPLSFTPDHFDPTDAQPVPTEKDLFEAFWICIKAVAPSGAELEPALSLKQDLRAVSIPGGRIKLAMCPCCTQRWLQHDKSIRTIDKRVDIILENDVFTFMKSCPDRWQSVSGELQEYFGELKKRFKKAEEKSPEDWKKFIAERDAPKTAGETDSATLAHHSV